MVGSGRGRVWSWILMHQRYLEAFAADVPYNVALIELEEGPYIMSQVIGPKQLFCDQRVRVVFTESDGVLLPRFEVA